MSDFIPNAGTVYVASQCVVYRGSLVWDIESFLLFNTPGKSYSSPIFTAGDTKWCFFFLFSFYYISLFFSFSSFLLCLS